MSAICQTGRRHEVTVRIPTRDLRVRAVASRSITLAAVQPGLSQQAEQRAVAVQRMLRSMEPAHRRGVGFEVFPERALTTFFPRHYHDNIAKENRELKMLLSGVFCACTDSRHWFD